MTPVDLDAAEREWVRKYEPAADVVAALVTELRAAREVVWAFDHWRETHEGWQAVLETRAAYDKAVGS
jgi:hypothetical protein